MVRDRLAEPDASDGFPARRLPADGSAGGRAGQAARRPGHRPRPGARAGRRRRRGDPAAVRPAHLPGLRQDLARRVRRHHPARASATAAAASCSSATTTSRRRSPTRLAGLRARHRAAGRLLRRPGQAGRASTPPGRSRTSPSGRSTRCGRTAAEVRRATADRVRTAGYAMCPAVRQRKVTLHASSPAGHPAQDPEQIEQMRAAGLVVAEALRRMREAVAPGVSTAELDAHRRGDHPRGRRGAVVQGLPRLPGLDLLLGERAGRARHPVAEAGAARR